MLPTLPGSSLAASGAAAEPGLLAQVGDRVDAERITAAFEAVAAPTLTIVLIVVVAEIISLLAKRFVRRAVTRAKEPERSRRDDLRRRVGLAEGDPVSTERRAQRADAVGALAGSIISVIIWVVAVIMILGEIGVEIGPLIAGAGILGVAIGFGAQDLVKDFFSGLFMLIEDQYGVGDVIDVGEAVGVVEGLSLRSTRIRDVTGTLWHVPNGEIARVGNMSQEWARALLDVDVSYGTDIDAASDIIQRVASDMAREAAYRHDFLGEPEMWGVQDLGNDSVVLRLVIKTNPGEQWAITRELRRRIKMAFDVAEVEIPFPQRTVWLRTERAVAMGSADAPQWREDVPDEQVREAARQAALVGAGGPERSEAETVPDAQEAAAQGGGDVDEESS